MSQHLQVVLAGFINTLSLIVAIGSQNAFVLRQGIKKNTFLPSALPARRSIWCL